MRVSRHFPILLAAVLLNACSGGSEPEPTDADAASVVGDPLHRALEQADSVQATLDQRAAELRQRVEESEGD